jgi:predicted GNAT family acetyltransferase
VKVKLIDEPDEQQFLATDEKDNYLGEVMYVMRPAYIDVYHTGVNPRLEGQGVGILICEATMNLIRERNLKIFPRCPYLDHYLGKHPEFNDLIYR